jgi:bifunctional non-homologous end joining protein LigD
LNRRMAKPLKDYHAKRDFSKTAEPAGKAPAKKGGGPLAFVVQKHAARRLHYDFRLELDGVLKSWAVAKGPSLVPGDKRLAVHTEDHPMEYGGFEGTIPEGQYGGGTVLLWDRGTWEPEGDPHAGYAKGHLRFRLDGEKLRGAWHLVRMRPRPRETKEQWLLIKSEDEAARSADAPDILDEMPLSVDTGRDLDEIAAGAMPKRGSRTKARASRVWQSDRAEPQEPAGPRTALRRAAKPARAATAAAPAPAPVAGGKKAAMPKSIEPCLATLVEAAPSGQKWLHEIKWDGYRLVSFVENGKVRIATRNGHDWTHRFPAIAKAMAELPVETAVIDGEAVVEDENGISSFSALQQALSNQGNAERAILYAFDLLYRDGRDLRGLPLDQRKAALAKLIPPGGGGTLRYSEHVEADGEAMVRNACRLGLEGVVSKRRDCPYRSGRRDDWLKTKCTARQEFVIAGFNPSTAVKNAIGSLVLGYYRDGRLVHAGRTGTGFTAEAARDLYKRLVKLKVKEPPFAKKLPTLHRRGAVFVEPRLVAEVEFRGWSSDDLLRHAAYKGLREDKDPAEVVREAGPVATAAAATPARGRDGVVAVAGVELTHPDRVFWDDAGVTKQGLAEFYEEIADWVLPHLVGRPLALVRCPTGWREGCFFQKHSWAGLPPQIRRDTVRDESGEEEVLYIEDLPGLVALVQSGVLEIHPWGSTLADVDRPDRIVMDMDPGDDVAWPAVIEAAREARERLSALGLESFVKTTGGKGLHVVVPLTPSAGWEEVKAFARNLAEAMERDSPGRYVSSSVKRIRRGKTYVDYLRNGRGATAIAAYSTRARAGAPVAVPLTWDELGPAIRPAQFTIDNLPARLARLRADPWAELFRIDQRLPKAAANGPPARRAPNRAKPAGPAAKKPTSVERRRRSAP